MTILGVFLLGTVVGVAGMAGFALMIAGALGAPRPARAS